MDVRLYNHTNAPEQTIEQVGRVCYNSMGKITIEPSSAGPFIKGLLNRGHDGPLEHASATIIASGVSRALTHQLVRHRIASYCQESQRYVKLNEPEYVTPNSIGENGPDNKAWIIFYEQMESTWKAYNDLLALGIPAEDARFVLPNACCSKIAITMNFRSWRHFLKLRMDKHAQWEIREMAVEIHKLLMGIAPSCFEDLISKE